MLSETAVTCVPNGTITFPMLGDNFAIKAPASFNLFGLTIHWYGVIIAIGFLLAVIYTDRRTKDLGVTSDDFIDLMLWAVPIGIIGARLYYVIFYFDLYRNNPLDILKIWHGGLAIYGGVIAATITVIIFCHKRKIPVGVMLDLAGFGLIIGQMIGRWGNFINREAFGYETEAFCRMGLTNAAGQTIYVHPTFLYESLWNLVGFLIMHFFFKSGKRKYDGQMFAIYVAWYGLGRLIIEGLRTDSLYFFNTGIRVSQLLAGIFFICAIVFLAINGSRNHPKEKLFVNIKKEDNIDETKEQENT